MKNLFVNYDIREYFLNGIYFICNDWSDVNISESKIISLLVSKNSVGVYQIMINFQETVCTLFILLIDELTLKLDFFIEKKRLVYEIAYKLVAFLGDYDDSLLYREISVQSINSVKTIINKYTQDFDALQYNLNDKYDQFRYLKYSLLNCIKVSIFILKIKKLSI